MRPSRASFGRALVCCLVAAMPARAGAEQPGGKTVTFQLMDEVFPPEVDEVITVTINHVPIGTMNLGPKKIRDSFKATVPAADAYHYELCGHATIAGAGGKVETVKIDNGGTLDHLDGRTLGIFNGDDYITSYLRDMEPDAKSEADVAMTTGHSCPDTVS